MDFIKHIKGEMSSKHCELLENENATPYKEKISVSDYSIFKDKYRQYKKRLEDEKYSFNQAVDSAYQSRCAREQAERERARQERLRREEKKRKGKKFRKRLITAFVCIFCVCAAVILIPDSRLWVAEKFVDIKQYQIAEWLFNTFDDAESEAYIQQIRYYQAVDLINAGDKYGALNILSEYDVEVRIIDYSFDEFKNCTKQSTDDDGKLSTLEYAYIYDSNGRLIQKTTPFSDGGQAVVSYEYDSDGVLIVEKSESGETSTTTTYTYDKNGNCTIKEVKYKQMNYSDCLYEYTYDESGNCIKEIYYTIDKFEDRQQKFSSHEYSYDSRGNRIKAYTVIHRSLPGATSNNYTIYYSYDDNNNCIKERVVYPDGDTATTEYGYDKANQMIESYEYNTFNDHTVFTSYTYDSNGNCVKKIVIETDI